MTKVYYDADADRSLLEGKKIAVVGYGSQGHAHALNLKDSGFDVTIGIRPDSEGWKRAEDDGWAPKSVADAVADADIVGILVPDHVAFELWESTIGPALRPGSTVLFAHGFSIHFEAIKPREDIDVIMVAPKGPGHLVRRLYTQGAGVPCLIAVDAGRERPRTRHRAGLGLRRRRRPRGRARDDVRGGDDHRSLRRADRALRWRDGARPGRLRDTRGGGLPARDRVLRVPPRAQADRRPDVRGRPRGHALLDLRHGRVRRSHARPAHRRRARARDDGDDPRGDPLGRSSPRSSSATSRPAARA